MKHTPGPWLINRKLVTVSIRTGNGDYVTENVRALPNQDANARLIAAAPELYAACKALISRNEPTAVVVVLAKQAIAKVEGIS